MPFESATLAQAGESPRAEVSVRIRAQMGALTLDVALEPNAWPLVIIGPNGAGKTALLRAIVGDIAPSYGYIRVGDMLLFDSANGTSISIEARRFGYVPQGCALFPHLTVEENVGFGLQWASSARGSEARRSRASRIDALLSEYGLEAVRRRRPDTLSGGEQQRVALARAIAVEPCLLLLDEPLAALDVGARVQMRERLATTLSQRKIPAIMVSHDPDDCRALGNQIAVLERGCIIQQGTWTEIAAHPSSAFVAAFTRDS
jgi:molybdate transport system ATP-binding protein